MNGLVLAVIVLYREKPGESAAFASLCDLLTNKKALSSQIACLLYDNSPESQEVPATTFCCEYKHDAENAGLARAYEYGRRCAEGHGIRWLLLLDQDTRLTSVYLEEALQVAKAVETEREIVAIAPKLFQGDWLLSPGWPPRHSESTPLEDRSGPIEPPLQVYNSGAWLRVTALSQIGGFPCDFPFDYLDHAMFAELQQAGGRIYLLHSALQHDLAAMSMDIAKEYAQSARLQAMLQAEARFYRKYGTARDRIFLVLRRGRLMLRMLRARNSRGIVLLLLHTGGRTKPAETNPA